MEQNAENQSNPENKAPSREYEVLPPELEAIAGIATTIKKIKNEFLSKSIPIGTSFLQLEEQCANLASLLKEKAKRELDEEAEWRQVEDSLLVGLGVVQGGHPRDGARYDDAGHQLIDEPR